MFSRRRDDNSLDAPELLGQAPATPTVGPTWSPEALGPADASPGGPDAPIGGHREYTADQLAALAKIGARPVETETLRQKIARLVDRVGLKLRQGAIDQYASLMTLSERVWKLARMTHTASGAVEALLTYGRIYLDAEGAMRVDTDSDGLVSILRPLGEEVDDFLAWVAGNRAQRLMREGREHLFTQQDILAMIALADGNMADGRSRAEVYAEAQRKLKVLQTAVLDLSERAGIIEPASYSVELPGQEPEVFTDESAAAAFALAHDTHYLLHGRALWEHEFYVPFYRLAEGDTKPRGPNVGGGLVNQVGIRKLRGGRQNVNDLLANVVFNWNHLVSASLKNRAATEALEAAVELGVAEQVPEAEASQHAVYLLRDGKKEWYEISDMLVLDAVSSLSASSIDEKWMKPLRWFKRVKTETVTADPAFRFANLIRDSVSAIAVSPLSYNMLKNVHQGWKATAADSATKAQMLAGGGEMHFGHLYAADPKGTRLLLERRIADVTPRTPGRMERPPGVDKRAWRAFKKGWQKSRDFWGEWGSRFENVNRAAIYLQTLERTGSHFEASFAARDLVDFSQGGSWDVMRRLTATVSFLNAKIQGLDKTYRSARSAQQRGQLTVVTMAVIGLSLAFYLMQRGDQDYDDLEDWERDAYWMYKLPEWAKNEYIDWIRIPKPFEIGAVGSMAERGLEAILDSLKGTPGAGERFVSRLWHMLTETFSFNPIPQLLLPIVEVAQDESFFTTRPIEGKWLSEASPQLRRKPWTSPTAVKLSEGMAAIAPDALTLSPLQIEHLLDGYFSWFSAMGLASTDLMIRAASDTPVEPTMRPEQYIGVGRFVRKLPKRHTRYETLFYEFLGDVERAQADASQYKTLGELENRLKSMQENRDITRFSKYLEAQRKKLRSLSKQAQQIRDSRNMDADQKRERLDQLDLHRANVVRNAVTRVQPHFSGR